MKTDTRLRESDLTKEILHELFSYHEEGYLIWKTRPLSHFTSEGNMKRFNTRYAGERVGYFNVRTDSKKGKTGFGYYKARVSFKTLKSETGNFKVHRLIFAWHKGYYPKLVDHKDCDTRNNRIDNLREADLSKNGGNISYNTNNTSGYKGVFKGKWNYTASLGYNGCVFYLGGFPLKEEAAAAYNFAAQTLHKEFANLNDGLEGVTFKKKSRFFLETLPSILDGSFDWEKAKQKRKKK